MTDLKINRNRFTGFADVYDEARPAMPEYPAEIIEKYLGRKPQTVVDLGCGTGLSSLVWEGKCDRVIGVEPNDDMLKIALTREKESRSFIKGFSHDIPLETASVDAVICSQSFHWMEPTATLREVSRVLASGGVFAAVDCDWPPVCNPFAEKAYIGLIKKVDEITAEDKTLSVGFHKWRKDRHLDNIIKSGHFDFAREIVFANRESCDANRFIGLAMSQGSVQLLLRNKAEDIAPYIDNFRKTVNDIFGGDEFEIDFCYRMRIAKK